MRHGRLGVPYFDLAEAMAPIAHVRCPYRWPRWPGLILATLGIVIAGAVGVGSQVPEQGPAITGTVTGPSGPLAAARVRVQATNVTTTTDSAGRFSLPWPAEKPNAKVTAWAKGHFIGWATAIRNGGPVAITLRPYYTSDNADYPWFSDDGASGSVACSHCMPAHVEWLRDAHSKTALNPRFLSMYSGTDLDGHQSPPTLFVEDEARGRRPMAPDPAQPHFGPGFKLDFPTENGTCTACHVPLAALRRSGPFSADLRALEPMEKDGISCELCHKTGAVVLDPATGLPYPDRPGVLSMRLYRPDPGQQLFFGQFDDVSRRVSYLPLEEDSAFCAPCHHGVFDGVAVYDSYGEWLRSPYSDPRSGKTCQSCHMPPAGYDYFVYPDKGGLRRDASRILSHHMPGAANEALLRNSVTMTVTAHAEGGRLTVTVAILNDKTGHHVPTDSPLRQMILVVDARAASGARLHQLAGSKVPDWGGLGDPAKGYLGGLPGKAFAKVLEELGTGVAPTAAYWNPTRIQSDTRLAALATDTSRYSFALPLGSGATVQVSLLFRRAFKALADAKKWPDADIIMESTSIEVGPETPPEPALGAWPAQAATGSPSR